MKKLTEKQLNVLAREAAFADIKNDKENILSISVIRKARIEIPTLQTIQI